MNIQPPDICTTCRGRGQKLATFLLLTYMGIPVFQSPVIWKKRTNGEGYTWVAAPTGQGLIKYDTSVMFYALHTPFFKVLDADKEVDSDKLFWELDGGTCKACGGHGTATAAMRRKLEELW